MNNGLEVVIERVNVSDPIRNVRVYLPGDEASGPYQPFHPFLLSYLSSFRVLRWVLSRAQRQRLPLSLLPRFLSLTAGTLF